MNDNVACLGHIQHLANLSTYLSVEALTNFVTFRNAGELEKFEPPEDNMDDAVEDGYVSLATVTGLPSDSFAESFNFLDGDSFGIGKYTSILNCSKKRAVRAYKYLYLQCIYGTYHLL